MATGSDEGYSTVAGWTTPHGDGMLLLYLSPVPRPYGYLVQLRIDARGFKPWLFWLGGAGLIALGLALLRSQLADGAPAAGPVALAACSVVAGLLMLLRWLLGFLYAVHRTRTAPLGVGVVRELLPRPPWPELAFANAVREDGTVVRVTLWRVAVTRFLDAYGECEVLFILDDRSPWTATETGFALAARPPRGAGIKAAAPTFQWTNLSEAKGDELAEIARRTGHPVDAVLFVLFALTIAPRPNPGVGQAGRHITAQELCRFISKHSPRVFGAPAAASEALSAWGLRRGDDVGAIVMRCVEVGLMGASPDDCPEDFRGLEILPK